MAALSDSAATRLAIVDAAPEGFLDCDARDLHRLLDGPTLIELQGEREPPLFVSILLHGNEDSGLGAVQQVLREYCDRPLPRSMMLLVGNVEAAREGLRRLDGQPDFNRVWPGAPNHGHTPEAQIMAEAHARVVRRRALAAVDIHNNSGRNPHYAVVCDLDPQVLGLAAQFSRRVVRFRGLPGTQTASFTGKIAAATAECGRTGEVAGTRAAAHLIDALLKLDELPKESSDAAALDLYHTLGVVRVKDDVNFTFGPLDADLRFAATLDEHNFQELQPGTVLAETDHPMPLRMFDESGNDVAEDYFETSSSKLRLRKRVVPAMLTVEPRAVRQDCLCYLMERL